MERARILVVGAGLGGLALARALGQAGFAPQVIERASGWETAGTGMYLPANGVRALQAFGQRIFRAEGAVHGFLALVGARGWPATIEQAVPGGIAQAVKDAATFFETELPGVATWAFGPKGVRSVAADVVGVMWFRHADRGAEMRLVCGLGWLPGGGWRT